jgi:hypothetical protein
MASIRRRELITSSSFTHSLRPFRDEPEAIAGTVGRWLPKTIDICTRLAETGQRDDSPASLPL